MPAYWFALLICVLMSASATEERFAAERPLITTFGLVMLFALLAKMLAVVQAKHVLSGRRRYDHAARSLSRQLDALRWLWLPLGAVGLTALGLSQQIDQLPVGQSMAASAGILLLPSLLAIASTWFAEHEFIDWVGEWIDEGASQPQRRRPPIVAAVLQSFRLQAAWILAPVLLVLAIIDLAKLGSAGLDSQSHWISGAVGLLCLPFLLPRLISIIWPTRRCDQDPDTAWLCNLVRQAGFRGIEVRLWETDGRICTALVAGFIPGFRMLLLSDALLARLDRREAAMVVLHELAHVSRWHIALRMMTLLPTWAMAGFISTRFAGSLWAHAAIAATGLLVTMVALRWLSHATELDADRFACRMAEHISRRNSFNSEAPPLPATKVEAAYVLACALVSVCADHPKASRASWMHPSLASRIDRLNAYSLQSA